ncbi:germination protein, Ger(x)C family [Ruminiclostridium papyrosolvens DSM 2782]|uniref:Germination protein, Ger(X)C family n=1 Tax=Ruminiclostridium papyrosolvens DSM 2782 TaxID=588581 RepID=F1TAF8_9FIRM|nr:Ger(x)C family spore germination protein [Ruminiclostridium papyrosolvens]EGD48501.1 germination protein, Ger(x)C family [Ruminiclostridium papyrosolvens DSM 2782]WES32741.1 Ger(x)C family spore germination protein [Ruminiclostridium papyrosolvens DSM 2782]
MFKVSKVIVLLITFVYILTGCTTDSKNIDDQAYAIMVGIDKGVDNKIRLTVQFPTYKGGGNGSSSGGGGGNSDEKEHGLVDGTVVVSIECATVLEGINLLNTSTSRHISLVHCKAMIFSEQLAQEGINFYLSDFARFRETRRIANIGVCRGKAEEYIMENKTLIGDNIFKSIELSFSQSKNSGLFPMMGFTNFYKSTISPYSQAYSIYMGINNFKNLQNSDKEKNPPLKTHENYYPGDVPKKGNLKQEMIGTAIFNGDKLVGTLNAEETRYFLMVVNEFRHGILTIEDKRHPGMAIPFDLRPGRKPDIKVSFDKSTPIIDVNLNIEADIVGIQSGMHYESTDRIKELSDLLKDTIEGGVSKTIKRVQKQMGTDIFGFGYYAASKFITINDLEKYNWLSHFIDAKINVSVRTNIRRTGLVAETVPVRYRNRTAK